MTNNQRLVFPIVLEIRNVEKVCILVLVTLLRNVCYLIQFNLLQVVVVWCNLGYLVSVKLFVGKYD